MAQYVQYVSSDGNVNYNDCDYTKGVRPFWGGQRNRVSLTLKFGSHHQKNRQPFLKRIKIKEHLIMIRNDMTDFEKVTDFANLYSAYQKCKHGKGHQYAKYQFQIRAMNNLLKLQSQLRSKRYCVGGYNTFTIYEPKERRIEEGTFVDKIVQHAICDNVLIPQLQKEFINTNFAGQIGKGTLFGLNCLGAHQRDIFERYGLEAWILKADISKYFYNIDHDILKDIVRYHVSDQDVYWLCEKFIDSTDGSGIPLGNQISQVFALLYLSGLDHFITGDLGICHYGRYMDDFYLIHPSKTYLQFCLHAIQDFVQSLGLSLNKKTQLIPFKNGIRFCGFHTYVTQNGKLIRKLTNENKRKSQKKYRRMAKLVRDGKMKYETFIESYLAWKNHISHGNCIKLTYQTDLIIQNILEGKDGCSD